MDRDRFTTPEAGRLIRAEGGYDAFMPAPLPPDIAWDDELVLALSQADAALSELSGVGSQLPNPHLLIEPYVRREAVLSSRIEGTQASLADIYVDDVEPERIEASRDDVREVRNYVIALEYGLVRLAQLPLSLRLVREIHERLMADVRGEHATPGEFRRTQNWIGRPGCTLETSEYVPPPPEQMHVALADWEEYLHERGSEPDLVQCALIHEQFEAIHPFLDGNGRIGRLLITLFLAERERLSQPLLYLSAYFEANRSAYYDALQGVRTEGDWHAWLFFFLRGVEQVAATAARQAGEIIQMREEYRALVAHKPTALALVDELFRRPFVSAASVARALSVSDPTARSAIAALETIDLLHETTGKNWGRIWVAGPVFDIIDRPL
jgi:Fic family protein